MSCHVLIFVLVCKDMKRGMFERVIAPGLKDERKVKQHVMIIHAIHDKHHGIFGGSLKFLIKTYANSCCYLTQNGDNGNYIHLNFDCEELMSQQNRANNKSHIPSNSILFEKIVPAALIGMGIVTLGLILFAAGVLLGIVQF